MDNQKKDLKTFFNGNVFAVIVLNVIMGTISSLIPSGSLAIFLFAVVITVIEVIISWKWFKSIENKVRYNSLTAFLMLVTAGFFTVLPLLRLTYGSILFLLVLPLYLCVFIYTISKRDKIFTAFDRPEKSRLAKGVFIFIAIIFLIGSLSAWNGQELFLLAILDDQQGTVFVSVIIYAIGLFFTFISSVMLKHPDKIRRQ
ncbi:hypothetical protein J9303_07495 [Bacillaceae bacterium Marseille-Q3522]|nr:hypothetical protein [Bacillaceae bacterium Marseille-Q3522]